MGLIASILKYLPLCLFFARIGAGQGPSDLPESISVKTAHELQTRADVVIIDVREPSEYKTGHITAVKLIPMREVPNRLVEIPKDKIVVVTCRTGNRSSSVTKFLRQQGYTKVHNMEGGIVAWQKEGFEIVK